MEEPAREDFEEAAVPDGERMRFASALSEESDPEAAAESVANTALAALDSVDPDVAFLFCSPAYGPAFDRVAWRVRELLPGALLVGCTARSVIGGGREVEGRAGLSLTAARLPDVRLAPIRVAGDGFPRGADAWREHFEIGDDAEPQFVLLADPFSCDAESLVAQLGADFPGSTLIGGLASGAEQPGGNTLFLDERVHAEGLVGVALSGDVAIDSIVAQGCRPIGHPLFVTRVRDNLLVEVDGRPPLETVRALFAAAPPADRALIERSLFLGIEMRPDLSRYERGDFLVRNLMGIDAKTGAIAVAAPLREGMVVQFHVRDAKTSAEDLDERLARHREARDGLDAPAGALLFSCLGRGAWLYGVPDHDSDAFRRAFGAVPLGGFFCNGEIGPVERRPFVHGYTSAFGLFRPRFDSSRRI
jgi:small ligand-binding sensory domain FIST